MLLSIKLVHVSFFFIILSVRELEGSLLLLGTDFNAATPMQYKNTF